MKCILEGLVSTLAKEDQSDCAGGCSGVISEVEEEGTGSDPSWGSGGRQGQEFCLGD